MSMRCAGLLCTLLLIGAVAGLFGCMSAALCRRRRAFAVCLLAVLLDFASLAALLLTAFSLFAAGVLLHGRGWRLSPVSIKESCDHLPSALCFAWENGQPCLKNLKMDELSHLLTGEALLNANVFWKAVEARPIVALENGRTWSFERVKIS